MSVCPSVLPHGKTRLTIDRVLWNLMFEYFSKICPENSSFIAPDKHNGYFIRTQCTFFYHISLNSSYTEECFRPTLKRKSKHFMFNDVFENRVFYIHGSVHRNSILVRHNKMQQYAGIYLLKNYSTCFGLPSHPSSGIHKSVTAASGTAHNNWVKTFLQCDLIRPHWTKVVTRLRDMICTRSCSYTFMYSWWWVRWTPETYGVILQ
jgi:hypothetical protein